VPQLYKWVVDADHPAGWMVPLTAAEQAQYDADQVTGAAMSQQFATQQQNADLIRTELQGQIATALALADALDANTATPAQQRQALSLCLHGLVRLAKVAYRTYDQPA
jgi:hypothetical protein